MIFYDIMGNFITKIAQERPEIQRKIDIIYDIIKKGMISDLISYFFDNIRVAQERLSYDIIHDIIGFCMISCMILYMILALKI